MTADEFGWSDELTQLHEESAGADHPIDRLSRSWALSALRRHVRDAAPAILEVGCSSGFFLRELRTEWPAAALTGSDVVKEPLERLAARGIGVPLLQFDLVQCPLPSASLDAVVLLNVFEHIDDDQAAMRQVARILRPGDVYDEHLRHYRRYSASGLARSLAEAGLTPVAQSHLGCLLYPAFVLAKRRNQRVIATDVETRRRIVEASITATRSSALVRVVLQAEARLGRYVSYPFGIRCVAVARKPLDGRP